MNSMLIRRSKAVIALLALIGGSAMVTATLVPTEALSKSGQSCPESRLLHTLAGLRSSATLKVRKSDTKIVVIDAATQRTVFTAGCAMIIQHGDRAEAPRPAERNAARTIVRRDARGDVVYTHSVTARGARATVFAKGAVAKLGLHVTTFDNDDFHIADGQGALVHSVTTKSDGTLVEREGKGYGCGCERVTDPNGKTETRPLP